MTESPASRLKAYYRLHAAIYDSTRWSFLFGRDQIIRDLSICPRPPRKILEVGCGTGRNLGKLCLRYPEAAVSGLDLSEDMLRVARKSLAGHATRVRLLHQAYDSRVSSGGEFDLILFSYSLSMFNPGWQRAITAALKDLAPGGCLAVVDFESTPLPWFRRWMEMNHVRMEGHLLPFLEESCQPLFRRVCFAYLGCWKFFRFIGVKKSND